MTRRMGINSPFAFSFCSHLKIPGSDCHSAILYACGVPDVFTKAKRSQVMAAIRSRGNKATELRLATLLRAASITGWRRHQPLPGRPDFIFRGARLAVFVDGCFWHGCRWHCRMPKSRRAFWTAKIRRNKARDRYVTAALRSRGWRVLRVWEHSFREPARILSRLRPFLGDSRKAAR